VNIVVSEVDWLSSELLAIESNIDGILKEFRVEIVKLWNFRDDLAVLKVAFCSNPSVCFID